MNKRFSTLMTAGLLMVGALFSNANAQTIPASKVESGKVYVLKNVIKDIIYLEKTETQATPAVVSYALKYSTIVPSDVKRVEGTTAGLTYSQDWTVTFEKVGSDYFYKFSSMGKTLGVVAADDAFAFDASGVKNAFKWIVDPATATGVALGDGTNALGTAAAAAAAMTAATWEATGAATTAITPYLLDKKPLTAAELNENTGSSFQLSFKTSAKLDKVLTVQENPFTSNVITAVEYNNHVYFRVAGSWAAEDLAQTTGKISDGAKLFRASKFIVVDTVRYSKSIGQNGFNYKVVNGSDMISETGKTFDTQSSTTGATYKGVDAKENVIRMLGNAQFDVFADAYVKGNLMIEAATAKVPLLTGSEGLSNYETLTNGTVTINDFQSKNLVATGDGSNTYLTLGSSKIVPQKDLLGIVNITSNDKYNSATNNTYGKVFGPTTTTLATAQDANRVQFNKPEGQFVITSTGDGKFTFTNRESKKAYAATGLYYTETAGVYANDGDTIKITAVTIGDKYDGYKNYSAKIELEKTAFNMAVYSAVTDNVYLTEKHTAGHFVGLSSEKANAVNWRLVKFEEGEVTGDNAHANDSIIITNPIGYVNSDKEYKTDKNDLIVAFTYAIYNESNGEFLQFNADKRAYYCDPTVKTIDQARSAAKFVIKQKGEGVYNLINVTANPTTLPATSPKLYGAFSDDKLSENQASSTEGMYYLTDNDLFVIEPVDAPNYRPVATFDTISIYKEGNEKIALYERNNFLGMQHMADVKEMNSALFVDTAYVRANTNKPQYLLAVNAKRVISDDWCGTPGHTQHKADTTYGRFLVNMVDSAYAYGFDKHDNPYVWENNQSYKLAFMKGFHTNDTLFIQRANNVVGDSIWVGKDNNEAIGKYAFRYIDRDAKSFIIETQTRNADGELTLGFVKWLNGTPAVITGRDQAEVFNMNESESRIPTDNEGIETTVVSVIAGNGQVVINNAQGKTVAISNILGQTLANTVLTSDNATISVPAGIVVVAVEGEAAVKAIVK